MLIAVTNESYCGNLSTTFAPETTAVTTEADTTLKSTNGTETKLYVHLHETELNSAKNVTHVILQHQWHHSQIFVL